MDIQTDLMLAGAVSFLVGALLTYIGAKLQFNKELSSKENTIKETEKALAGLKEEHADLKDMSSALKGELALAQQSDSFSKTEFTKMESQYLSIKENAEKMEKELQKIKVDSEKLRATLSEKSSGLESLIEELKASKSNAETQISSKNDEIKNLNQVITDTKEKLAANEATFVSEKKILATHKEELKQEFHDLAEKIFSQTHDTFSKQSSDGIRTLISPLENKIMDFKQKLLDFHQTESNERAQMTEDIRKLHKGTSRMVSVIKGVKETHGSWGEMVLDNVLERSGLVKGREFHRDIAFENWDGKNKSVDAIINLPEARHFILDASLSTVDYLEYVNAENKEQQEEALARHVKNVREHIEELTQPNYEKLLGIQAPDFVFMFIAMEPAFNAAFQADPTLFDEAFDKRIVVVTPTTLLVTLKTVANIWRLEQKHQDTKELAIAAGEVHDRLSTFAQKLVKLESHIVSLHGNYMETVKDLKVVPGNLISKVADFGRLGANFTKEMPKSVLESKSLVNIDEKKTPSGAKKAVSKTKKAG